MRVKNIRTCPLQIKKTVLGVKNIRKMAPQTKIIVGIEFTKTMKDILNEECRLVGVCNG
jgi:hypothetical protein